MVRTLQSYLQAGEPIQVRKEDGLLIPYELQKKSLIDRSSSIGPQTPISYHECLVRVEGEPSVFNPSEFIKESLPRSIHLSLNLDFMNHVVLLSPTQKYIAARVVREKVAERGKASLFTEEKWENLEDWKKEEILSQLPLEEKLDYAFETMKSIMFSAKDDCLYVRERAPWANEMTTALYEIQFNESNSFGVDVFLKKPESPKL